MKYSVNLTKTAEKDLWGAIRYIRDDLKNPDAARRLIEQADAGFHSLSEFPYRHPLISDKTLSQLQIRHTAIEHFLIFYIIKESSKTVSVIRFLYGKREWMELLKET